MSDYETKKIFSKNLSRLLSAHNITQAELANILNVSPASISGWCTGDKMPRMNKIEKIAQYFEVQKSDLIEDHSDRQVQEDEQYRRLKELAAKMEEDDENGVVILRAKGKSQKSYRIPEEKITLLEMLAKELMEDDD